MNKSGPELQRLTRRLAETPADFLDEPLIQGRGRVAVAALVHDALRRVGYRPSSEELQRFVGQNANQDRNRLQLVALAVWLLDEDWFNTATLEGPAVMALFDQALQQLAEANQANKYVNDSERREEFARYLLARLDYRPAGESAAQATDRLSALSSTERKRLLQESREAERRARAIREALAKKAADESADKWTRE
ncbi:MAG TPA: hypothetical protein VM553_16770 [Dongiaceae bacterium]|nr:hypothetical protein [Dongiaceae bacterium]